MAVTKGKTISNVVPVPTAIPTPTPKPAVNYYLPYPGMLPDQVLYPIKMLRDRLSLMFTSDPVKKSEKMLLYADKRLGASKALIEGNKLEIGVSTLTKGEKYLEQAIAEAQKAKKSGKDTSALFSKLSTASLKHQEVIESLLPQIPDSLKKIVEDALRIAKQSYEAAK